MSRTVTALYDSRPEAETARARLNAELPTQSSRIIGSDSIAALDTLKLEAAEADLYRAQVQGGSVLLVAEVASGQDPDRIVGILDQSSTENAAFEKRQLDDQGQVGAQTIEEARIPKIEEELRIGKREVSRGGAHVRSFVREEPAQQEVVLRSEHVEVDQQPTERRLSDDEVRSGGLLKDRIIEVSEMREEPVVTKEAVVREEVIVRKTVSERTETVHDTVRHTEVEVEELPGDEPRSGPGRPSGGL